MESATQVLAPLSAWLRPHLPAIATTFTTALLVIYGDHINAAVKRRVRGYPFLVRTAVFVLLCSLGYGLLTALLTPSVSALLHYFGDQYLAPAALVAFLGVGWLAERKKYL